MVGRRVLEEVSTTIRRMVVVLDERCIPGWLSSAQECAINGYRGGLALF